MGTHFTNPNHPNGQGAHNQGQPKASGTGSTPSADSSSTTAQKSEQSRLGQSHPYGGVVGQSTQGSASGYAHSETQPEVERQAQGGQAGLGRVPGTRPSGGPGAQESSGSHKDENLLEHAKDLVSSELSARTDEAAGNLRHVANAIRETGHELVDRTGSLVPQNYIDKVADEIQRGADYIRSIRFDQMSDDAERFARRSPLLFLGGVFALGVIGSRFIKASSRPAETSSTSGQGLETRRMIGAEPGRMAAPRPAGANALARPAGMNPPRPNAGRSGPLSGGY